MKDLILYDGTCSLCLQTKKSISALDWFGQLNWVSLEEYEQGQQFFNKEELRKEIHLLTESGKVLKGFSAIRRIMLKCPLLIGLGVVCYLPFAEKIGNPLYRFVATRRYLFLGKACKDGSCSIS
jgi:predicted DCC family thiol-disulfide oxidoreductase YuxK